MTLIKSDDTQATAPVIPDPKALTCTLEKSSPYRNAKDVVRVSRGHSDLEISFQRTVRVPDGKGDSELPPGMGTFPLYSVTNYAEKLPKDMAAKGGLFLPMYQREAMWISLRSRVPFAVQVYVGGVNAISGEPVGEDEATLMRRLTLMEKKESIQDYVVTPKQLWLDGIATGNGRVRQFVAMPLGSGYSVEAQVTGQDLHGGLQFHVTASTPKPLAREPLYYKYSPLTESVIAALKKPKSPDFDDSPIQIKVMFCSGKECDFLVLPSDLIAELKLQLLSREGIPYSELRLTLEWKMLDDRRSLADYNIQRGSVLRVSPIQIGGGYGRPPHISKDVAMGVAPGGFIKQCVLEDTNLATIWERDHTICFNVQILNSAMFQQVTGTAPPSTPISAKAYADQGLPFYKIYGETSTVKGDFDGIKSVKQLDNIKNENGKRKNEGNSALKTNKKQKDISDGEKDDSDEAEDNSDSEEEEDGGSDNEEDYSDEHDQLDTDQDEAPVDDDGDKQTFQNPVIVLNPDGSAMGKFTPVSELMEELSRMKLRNSKLRPAKG